MESKYVFMFICFGILLGVILGLQIYNLTSKVVITDNREKPLYETVINRFAETHTYNLTAYNCVNYSKDLGFILDNLGYSTEQLTIRNETSAHRKILLILEIEPQTGEIGIKTK